MNTKSNRGSDSLHVAAERGHAEALHVLITGRWSQNYDSDGRTALYLAALNQ